MRFGRRRNDDPDAPTDEPTDRPVGSPADGPAGEELPPARSRDLPEAGPYDVDEVDLEERELIDMGSILLPPPQDMELRLQVEEKTRQVVSVLLVGDDGALELRAFAASRGGGAWEELRPRIVAETARVGGRTAEQEGTFGSELLCLVPVKGPDGETATQASRISGHEGPTWLLRANLMGNAAVQPEVAARWEAVVRGVVVRRGPGPMAPGSPLPLTLPPDARPSEASAANTPANPPGKPAAGTD